jgi:hypothetical protein
MMKVGIDNGLAFETVETGLQVSPTQAHLQMQVLEPANVLQQLPWIALHL